jgi:hypothetical protein
MSSAVSWEHLAERASHLSSAERLCLVERIVHDIAVTGEPATSGRRRLWSEVRGRVAYPLCGADAQALVLRTRSESDESREVGKRSLP